MLRPGFWIVLTAVLVAGAAARAQPVGGRPACPPAQDYAVPDEALPHVAAAMRAGGPLRILAVGSATTVGQPSSIAHGTPPGESFPFRMAEALQRARPHVPVQLTVRGGRGLTAEAMLPLLEKGLRTQHPQLVVWQTGTVEAVRGDPPDAMQTALEDGADMVHAAGADLVLVDSQFSRFLRANADLDPYESVLQQIAAMPEVVLFHRFDLMHDWVHQGHIDLERTNRADRPKTIALLNVCLGQALAQFVLNGATQD